MAKMYTPKRVTLSDVIARISEEMDILEDPEVGATNAHIKKLDRALESRLKGLNANLDAFESRWIGGVA